MNSYKDGNSMGAKLGWQHRLGRTIGGKVGASVGVSMGTSAGASVGAAIGAVGGRPGRFIGGAVGGLAGGAFGAKHGKRIGERVGYSAVSLLGTLKGMSKKFLIASAAKIRKSILGKLPTTKTKKSHMNTYKAGKSARYAGGLKSGHNRWKVGQAVRGNQKRGFGDHLNSEQGKNHAFKLMDSLRKAARITLSYKAEVELISWTL